MIKRAHRKRYAFTLQELVIVSSLTTVMLGLTMSWMHQTMKFASSVKQRQQHHTALTRLSWQLRADVHNSREIRNQGKNQLVLIDAQGLRTIYRIDDHTLSVEKKLAGADVAADSTNTAHLTFRLKKGTTMRWENSQMPDWISLIVSRAPEYVPSDSADHPSATASLNPILIDSIIRVAPNRWGGSVPEDSNEKPEEIEEGSND